MPPRKPQPVCEIVFKELSIPVYDLEEGKKQLEGVFMIGGSREITRGKAKKGKGLGKVGAGGTRKAEKEKRMKKVAELLQEEVKPAEIARRVGAAPMTILRDIKDIKGQKKESKKEDKETKKEGKESKKDKKQEQEKEGNI